MDRFEPLMKQSCSNFSNVRTLFNFGNVNVVHSCLKENIHVVKHGVVKKKCALKSSSKAPREEVDLQGMTFLSRMMNSWIAVNVNVNMSMVSHDT